MSLPTDRDARNALQVWDGCISYFPDAWAEIAKVSAAGNKQYNFGGPLRWERDISTDHFNKVMRHMLDHRSGAVLDTDGCFHLAKAAWRVLAALQLAIEAQQIPEEPALNQTPVPEEPERGPQSYSPPAGPPLILRLESGDYLPEAFNSGQANCENTQRDSNQAVCAAGTPISGRGQESRTERASQSIWEWFDK